MGGPACGPSVLIKCQLRLVAFVGSTNKLVKLMEMVAYRGSTLNSDGKFTL